MAREIPRIKRPWIHDHQVSPEFDKIRLLKLCDRRFPREPAEGLKMAGVRVAYILLWFPEPSQTFVLNEVNTLYKLGLDLKVYCSLRPATGRPGGGNGPSGRARAAAGPRRDRNAG